MFSMMLLSLLVGSCLTFTCVNAFVTRHTMQSRARMTLRAQQLEAILWDMDGVLADTERDGHRPAFNQAFSVCS